MPFIGLGLHVLVALCFAVHAVRSGQQTYWLFILFSFPLLGSIVYFVAVYLPDSRLERGARKAVRGAVKALDPTRELRAARADFEDTPTAQNQMRLAAALLEAGATDEALQAYAACLHGPFAGDHEIRFGAARAALAAGKPEQTVRHLRTIRAADAGFRAEALALLLARALGDAGHASEARAELQSAVERFGSFEARAEFAIWAAQTGDRGLAIRLHAEIEQSMRRWNRHTRTLNAPLLRRLKEAFAALQAAG
ncbi:hypothetical protein HLB44_15345 [Aquincola sp. S2]|uniref:Tetratricopeptide repeat protein n=1 Tax=Pseudaquabacterium terrae TaxID=2732868 RepID=A0ABX2EID1_9BURK|nr:hypothetical protein [Aquabacterium terrae]NRF68368.1 hypothetical protein [Aquabacterium terrae]